MPPVRTSPFAPFLALTCLALGLAGCGTAQISDRRELDSTPHEPPTTIWVADFDLDVADVQTDSGVVARVMDRPRILSGPVRQRLSGSQSPSELARDLVEHMSTSLVEELQKSGWTARRLPTGSIPREGWLLRGVFTEVNEGNRLRRALIGFGAGKTDLQVVVGMLDLASQSGDALSPFYEVSAHADSGKSPGAGPLIALNPASAAARFIIAGGDLDRNVRKTAAEIAREINARATGIKPSKASER